jgi:hypothetical protein
MKKIQAIFLMILSAAMVFTACQDDGQELGAKLDESQIDFEVIQERSLDAGGNTVVLKNNTPGTISMWDYGTGKSNRAVDTVRFAFKGEYVIKFSALTAGGVVELEPVTIQVTEDNLNYVNDPLWTNLTGGVGNEKTWILDFGGHGIFAGPLTYYEPLTTWQKVEDGSAVIGWAPEWAGNTWIIPEADKASTMTFSLKGGPFMKTHKVTEAKDESGTFFLDVDAKTITTTDATILRSASFIPNASNWNNNLVVLSLTEDQLQIGVRRTNSEGDYLYSWNFISKEYADNYVPEDQPDPNFDFGDQSELLSVTPTKTWKLDLEVPYNWADLSGKLLNDWDSRADIMATGWAPYGDADVANIDNASISFNQNGQVTVTQDNGSTATGTYAIDEPTNVIQFTGITPSIAIAGFAVATTTEDNTWKIVKVEKSPVTDAVTGIWLGKRDPVKSEYMVFHFVQR